MTGALLGLPSAVSFILCVVVSVLVVVRKPGPSWKLLFIGGLAVAWWCLGQFLWVFFRDPADRLSLAKLQYFGITATPVLWFLVTSAYAGSRFWLKPWRQVVLWIIPAITVALALTNDSHHLIWATFEPVPDIPRVTLTYGPWFWVHVTYAYAIVVAGTLTIAARFFASPLYRPQLVAVLFGPAAILCANLIHLTARAHLPIDPTPSSFAIAYLLLGWAVLKHRLFDLAPLVRARALESLREGVVVLDTADRIVDANASAASLLGPATLLGRSRADVLPDAASLTPGNRVEVRLSDGRRIDVEISEVSAKDGVTEGSVLLLRDVTEARDAQDRLLQAQAELQRLNQELESIAHTDALTGLANRRRFLSRLSEEFARARRHGRPLSLLIFDLDHFKAVNDKRGHLTGDRVLEDVGKTLAEQLRPSDVPARYGGEEFAMLLPDADDASACATARRLFFLLRGIQHRDTSGASFQVTVSCGVSTIAEGDTVDLLIERADQALYFIKHYGRDGIAHVGHGNFEPVALVYP